MKSKQIISTILVFAFTTTSVPTWAVPARHCEADEVSLAMTKLAPKSRLAEARQIEGLSGPNEELYKKICGDISRISVQVINLGKLDVGDLTRAITDAVSSMPPEQFSQIAPHLVNFLAREYEKYDDNSYGPNAARARLGIISGLSKIGEKAAEAKLEPIVASIIKILNGTLNSNDETGWLSEISAKALGDIGETLMLSELENREDIAKRITIILRGYITEGKGLLGVVTEAAIRALGKIGIREKETVSILQELVGESDSVLQEPAQQALQQLGARDLDIASPSSESSGIQAAIEKLKRNDTLIEAISELAGIGKPAVRPLLQTLKDAPFSERDNLLLAIVEIKEEVLVPALIEVMADDPLLLSVIIDVFLSMNQEKTLQLLIKAFKTDHVHRGLISYILSGIGEPAARALMSARISDPAVNLAADKVVRVIMSYDGSTIQDTINGWLSGPREAGRSP